MSERLTALRAKMLADGLFGFVLPLTDRYHSEYVAERDNRLGRLTGFTGSTGEAFIFLDRAFLFVDGRYVLQAQKETNPADFTVVETPNAKTPDWLLSALPAGAKIGYDAWLHTPNDVKRMVNACSKHEALLVPVERNPVDEVCPAPDAPVSKTWAVPFDIKYAGRDSTDKIAEQVSALNVDKDDALVLSASDSIAWLLNVRGGDVAFVPVVQSFAILHKNGTLEWFVDPDKISDYLRSKLSKLVEIKPETALADALDALAAQKARVQLSMDLTPAWIYERLTHAGATIHPQDDPCQMPKACKNKIEREGAVVSHIKDGAAVCKFLAWFDKNAASETLTEQDAADKMREFRAENPLYRGDSFGTIAAFGENGAIVHYHTGGKNNARIMKNNLFLIDSGAQYLDGTTDVTRTIAVGKPTELMMKRYTQVLKGHLAIAGIVFPEGTTGAQLDILARQFLWRDGVDFAHGTGHGVGSYLCVHEGPQRISRLSNKIALQAGMLVSNEPGYYKEGAFGIRIENVVMVEPLPQGEGAEIKTLGLSTLTLAPFDRNLIDKSQLTPRERAWIDGYHARIKRIISPLVDADTAAWLDAACAPL